MVWSLLIAEAVRRDNRENRVTGENNFFVVVRRWKTLHIRFLAWYKVSRGLTFALLESDS